MTVEDLRTERTCPRCLYSVRPGWVHEEMKQPEGSNVTVCKLERAPAGVSLRGPLVEVIGAYLDEHSPIA